MKQILIAIDREFGSGGQEIARLLSEKLGIRVYDHNIVHELKKEGHLRDERHHDFDENPRSIFRSRTVRGLTNSNEASLALKQFDFLKRRADAGESYIVLGHCADEILKGREGLVTIFISASDDFKIKRTMKREHLSRDDAELLMRKKSKDRKAYHNSYGAHKWGDSRHYDLCLKSDSIGIQNTVSLILDYIALHQKVNRKHGK